MAPGRAAATRDALGKDVYAAHYAAGASLTLDSMAVMNRVVTPAGPFGQRTRNVLMAEAERRGLTPVVEVLAGAAIAQGKAMVETDADGS